MKIQFSLISGILGGRHYNRCVKAHKCMFEALSRCYWQEFLKWLETEEMDYRLEHITNALAELRSVFDVEDLGIEIPNLNEKLQVLL